MKKLIIGEGLSLLFSWIGGLIVDDTIQKSIAQYPDSYQIYQLVQHTSDIENVLTPVIIFIWIIASIIYLIRTFK